MRTGIKKLFWLLCAVFAVTAVCFVLGTGKTAVKASSDTFEMENGASVRFADDDSGIRFRVVMGSGVYDEIVTNDDGDHVKLKFIITSKANFDAAGGDYWGIDNKRVADVDENKIYQDGDYYYANGCLTQIRENNRNVSLVAIAVKLTDDAVSGYAAVNGVGATGKMYDVLNQALLTPSNDYVSSITTTSGFAWYGTADYPVYINTAADYEKLADKFSTKSELLEGLKYNIVDDVNAGTIDNATFDANVTATYRVTFDPANGGATTSAVYKSGETIVPPSNPVKAEDDTYTYSFSGWSGMPATCTESATYTAAYTPVYKNYTVTFKTHDGSAALNTKTDYHYGDEITTAPAVGTTYTVAGTTYEVAAYQSAFDTVNGNAEILVTSYRCAPSGKVQGYFNMFGDTTGKEKADDNTYLNLNAHMTLGGLSMLNGERVLYRILTDASTLDQSSAVTLYYVPNDILTELYVPFYLISVDGDLDMNMRLYAGAMGTTLPVVYKDVNGNTVAKANLTTETWYTAVYTLTGATATLGQKYKLTMGAVGASVELYYGRPYFALANDVNIDTFNNVIKDNLAETYRVTFDPANGDAVTKAIYQSGDTIVPPSNPVKAEDDTYTYSFSGWSGMPATCTGSATYTAVYTPTYKNYTVTFKTHDGSAALNTKTDYHYGDTITNAPALGTTYTISGTTYEVAAYQSDYSTVSGNTDILVASYKLAPTGKVQGYFNMYGDTTGKEKADDNTYLNLNAHMTLGNYFTLNGERVLYRILTNAAGLDQSSAVTLYYVPNDILAELYVPFYLISVDGDLDMNMRRYAGSMSETLPVVYKDVNGNTVAKANLETETWYTAVYTLTDATATYNQKYKLTMGATGASVELYYGRPYFALADGISVDTFNNDIKDNLATIYETYNGKTGEVFATDNYSVKYLTYHNGSMIPVYNSGVNVSFSETLWNQYLDYQTSGGKAMTMDVKFINVGTNEVNYNGEINYGSSYGAISNAFSYNFRQSNKFFIFYNSNGQSVNYQNLAFDTWYKMVIDIDAIKTGVAAQNTRVYGGRNCSSIFFRSGDDAIAIGNVSFVDYQIAFKTGGGGTVSTYLDQDGALVTVGSSSHQWNGRLFFADTLWTKYIAAQTAGGKVMSMNIKFDDTVSLSGYISGNNADLNTYRANKTYFRFYNANGTEIDYANLVAGTWYRLVMDIDAIKTGIATQEWQNDGANSTIKFARESSGTISVKNVQFVDKANENA